MLGVLADQELIGHTSDVVAHHDVARRRLREFFVRRRHRFGHGNVITEKLFKAADGAVAVFSDRRMIVDVSEEEAFEFGIALSRGIAESGKAFWCAAYVLDGLGAAWWIGLDRWPANRGCVSALH